MMMAALIPRCAAIFDHLRDGCSRQNNHCQVDWIRHIPDAWIAAQPEDLIRAGIDRVNAPRIPVQVRFFRMPWLNFPGLVEAPMTATPLGSKKGFKFLFKDGSEFHMDDLYALIIKSP